VTEFHSDKVNSLYRITKFYCGKHFVFKFVILKLMVPCDRDLLGQTVYISVFHRLTRTSRFIEQSDRVSSGHATSVN